MHALEAKAGKDAYSSKPYQCNHEEQESQQQKADSDKDL